LTSIRRRTLTLIIGLVLIGLTILTLANIHDSNHEIAEVYDAQLATNARLLQGVMPSCIRRLIRRWGRQSPRSMATLMRARLPFRCGISKATSWCIPEARQA
jgi:hypothetical protein